MEQIKLDIIPKGITPICHASQYDTGRIIRLNIMDGMQGYILTDEEITLNVRKPDNNIVTAGVSATSGNSYVDIVTTEQMTACEGDNLCELVLVKGDVKIASLNFKMRVEEDPLKDGIESETEIHNLETQIQDINEEVVPPIVAEEVANQYDSSNVIFDEHPTAGHGTGYVVASENVPAELNDLDDVTISGQASGEALVWDGTKWTNGTVSTVGSIDDLDDVAINNVSDKQELVYDDGDAEWKNKTTRVELTQAEYDALANPLPDVDYYITDAPSMQGTSADLSYDGDTESTHDVIEEVKGDVGDISQLTTTDKSSLVNAVKEVNTKVGTKADASSALKRESGSGSASGTTFTMETGGSTNACWLVFFGGTYVGIVTIFSTSIAIAKLAGSINATVSLSGTTITITLTGEPWTQLRYVKLFG